MTSELGKRLSPQSKTRFFEQLRAGKTDDVLPYAQWCLDAGISLAEAAGETFLLHRLARADQLNATRGLEFVLKHEKHIERLLNDEDALGNNPVTRACTMVGVNESVGLGRARLLLDAGGNPNHVNVRNGDCPLSEAIRVRSVELVELLVQHNLDVSKFLPIDGLVGGKTDDEERTLVDIGRILKNAGASVQMSKTGTLMGHSAAAKGQKRMLEFLVNEVGIDLHQESGKGLTVKEAANEAGEYDIVDWIDSHVGQQIMLAQEPTLEPARSQTQGMTP